MFINLADDPPIERLILPRTALTVAEYLAFELDLHVLVVLTDMTYYAEALREVATAKGDVPTRKGYPGYLYSDLGGNLRARGTHRNRHGSITMVPVLSMPSDDITHPIPGPHRLYHRGPDSIVPRASQPGLVSAGGCTSLPVASDEGWHRQGLYAGKIMPALPVSCMRAYAKAQEIRNLASIIGPEGLSEGWIASTCPSRIISNRVHRPG